MKRSTLLLALMGMLAASLALSACSSKKMMQLDAPIRHAERTT
jgi:hypothetical protein